MWKVFCVCFLVHSDVILCQFNVTDRILDSLERNLNYIDANYERINVDCLFGVILAHAFLDDVKEISGPYWERIESLQNLTLDIYNETQPLLENDDYGKNFVDYVTIPGLWNKQLEFFPAKFANASPEKHNVPNILRAVQDIDGKIEQFVDSCIKEIIAQTIDLELKMCHYRPACQLYLTFLNAGYSYILTHKLLLLQIANQRKCYMDSDSFAKAKEMICGRIYKQVLTEEAFLHLDTVFDLFLEQVLLCGYEGYSDFLKPQWLEFVLEMQEDTGCFRPSKNSDVRTKRESNYFEDGCSDHTTGLGAGFLSLYLNFYLKTSNFNQEPEVTTDWSTDEPVSSAE